MFVTFYCSVKLYELCQQIPRFYFWHAWTVTQYLRTSCAIIYGKFISNFPVFFASPCVLVCKLYKSGLQTISDISDMSRHKNVKAQFIPGMSGNWVNIYIWGILVLPFMESWISTFQYFSSFFYLVCELPKSLFQLIFVNQ